MTISQGRETMDSAESFRGQTSASSRWADIAWLLVIFVASRLFILGMIAWSRMIIIRGRFWHPGDLLSILTHLDGTGYVGIARKGYRFFGHDISAMHFFPLYPKLVKLLNPAIHNVELTAVLTSNLSLLVGGWLLNELVKKQYLDVTIRRAAILFLMFNPASFLFSAAYPESMFLMLSAAAFLAATSGNWPVASVFGFASSATNAAGFLLMVPLLIEYWMQLRRASREDRKHFDPRILSVALIPGGLAIFLLYGNVHLDFPFRDMFDGFAWTHRVTSPVNATAYALD